MKAMVAVRAQRRPGHAPRRHTHAPAVRRQRLVLRSTKAGARTPATRWCRCRPSRGAAPLNEGRGTHPGDTASSAAETILSATAQRRPGHAPRRHVAQRRQPEHIHARSTKAGARTPATRHSRGPSPRWMCVAQRRPGHAPRRHALRSTRSRAGAALNEGRGTHPGDTAHSRAPKAAPWPLNEGRGTHPGDTLRQSLFPHRPYARSTKAGARTPATRAGRSRRRPAESPLNEGRGTHPGDTRIPRVRTRRAMPLNEGRGTHPGDTAAAARGRRPAAAPLNEGRGTHPGDTRLVGFAMVVSPAAQRRPGHAPRRHR